MSFLVHGVARTGGKVRARQIGEHWNFDEAVVLHFDHLGYAARKCEEMRATATPPPEAAPTKA